MKIQNTSSYILTLKDENDKLRKLNVDLTTIFLSLLRTGLIIRNARKEEYELCLDGCQISFCKEDSLYQLVESEYEIKSNQSKKDK